MRKIFSLAILVFFIFIGQSFLYPQGLINGIVADSLSKDKLFNAEVTLTGTAFKTISNNEGKYIFSGIPYGWYTLKVYYLGYKPKEIIVNIDSEKTINVDFELIPDLENETGTKSQQLSQNEVINLQLNTANIVNVVPLQKLKKMEDVAVANAIGRLPGISPTNYGVEDDELLLSGYTPSLGLGRGAEEIFLRGLSSKYSVVNVDGVRVQSMNPNNRGVDFSNFSQESFSAIEISKTLTSDKDGDVLAGLINFLTKKAPEKGLFKFESRDNYNNLDRSFNQYGFNFYYGKRFFSDLLGVQFIGNIERKIKSNDQVKINYDQTLNNSTDYRISNFGIQYNNQIKIKDGVSILLDLNTPENGYLRFNNYFNKYSLDAYINNNTFRYPNSESYLYRFRQSEIKNYISSLSGENNLLDFTIDWNAAFSESKLEKSFDYSMDFEGYSFADINGVTSFYPSGLQNIPAQYNKGPIEVWIPYATNNFEMTRLSSAVDTKMNSYRKQRTVSLNILKKYSFGNSVYGKLKFGAKYNYKYGAYNEYYVSAPYYLFGTFREYLKLGDSLIVKKDYSGTRFNDLLNKDIIPLSYFLSDKPAEWNVKNKYRLIPFIDLDALKLWRGLNINGYGYPRDTTSELVNEYIINNAINSNSYNLTEKIAAGYIMNSLNLGQSISFITGIRLESEDNYYASFYTPSPLFNISSFFAYGEIKSVNASHEEISLLPNFHLFIKPIEFLNLRVAAYKTIIRPDYNDRLPKFIVLQNYSGVNGNGSDLIMGNANLQNESAWNYEIQTQFYGSDIGLLSINAFYKSIKGMVHYLSDVSLSGTKPLDTIGVNWEDYTNSLNFNTSNYYLNWPYNSIKPTLIWGFEIEHLENFNFLPGFLKNITLNYNLSFVRSETWVKNQIKASIPRPPLPPQTKYILIEEKRKLENQPTFFANASLGYDLKEFSFRFSYYYQDAYDYYYSFDRTSDIEINSYSRIDVALKQQINNYLSIQLNINNVTNSKVNTSIVNRVHNWKLPYTSSSYGTTIDLTLKAEF
jgi:TonB-dependent receptor